MPKEYRTIQEVAGPLMLVKGVENVTYDELAEIELANGEKRRCKVLEINEGNALEHVMIPELQTNIKYITMKLDENERPTQIRLMKVKDMMLKEAHHYEY